MWRPATKTGTNDVSTYHFTSSMLILLLQVPIASGKRRFGLPEEAPPPAAPPSSYSRPPANDIQYFNGRQERDREPERERPKEEYRREERRDDYDHRREDYRRDDRGGERERDRYGDRERERGGDERSQRPRWDEEKPREPERVREVAPVDGESFHHYGYRNRMLNRILV